MVQVLALAGSRTRPPAPSGILPWTPGPRWPRRCATCSGSAIDADPDGDGRPGRGRPVGPGSRRGAGGRARPPAGGGRVAWAAACDHVERIRDAARSVDDMRPVGGCRVSRVPEPGAGRQRGRHGAVVGRQRAVASMIEGLRDRGARPARAGSTRAAGRRPPRSRERVRDRLRLSAAHTIVALAGATGSGKSSLFNALTGLDLAAVGVKRPTTSWATACAWDPIRSRRPARLARRAGPAPGVAAVACSTRRRRTPSCRAWCCSTCPTTTRPRCRTTSRSTGWSATPT